MLTHMEQLTRLLSQLVHSFHFNIQSQGLGFLTDRWFHHTSDLRQHQGVLYKRHSTIGMNIWGGNQPAVTRFTPQAVSLSCDIIKLKQIDWNHANFMEKVELSKLDAR